MAQDGDLWIDNQGRARDESGRFAKTGLHVKRVEKKDLGAREISRQLKELEKYVVEIGFPGGTPYEGEGTMDAANLALVQEKGSSDGNIPARPANRKTFDRNVDEIEKQQRNLYYKVLRGSPAKRALKALGVWYEGILKLGYMRGGDYKPNAPSTIIKKKSSKPLIDTKTLVNSIASKLRHKRFGD